MSQAMPPPKRARARVKTEYVTSEFQSPTRPRGRLRKAPEPTPNASVAADTGSDDQDSQPRKRVKFKPMSGDELKELTHDGVFPLNPNTLKNKASTLRRFVETVRRDPTNLGAPYLTGNSVSLRRDGSNEVVSLPLYSKLLGPQHRKGRDYVSLDDEIERLVNHMKAAGFNAAYPSFVQSFGYGKWARKSTRLSELAQAAAATAAAEAGAGQAVAPLRDMADGEDNDQPMRLE